MKKPRIFSEEPASLTFRSFLQLQFLGDVPELHVAECQYCGRTFLTNRWKDQLYTRQQRRMQRQIENSPEWYILTGSEDHIALAIFDEEYVILECPCNKLAEIERSLRTNQDLIEAFYAELKSEMETVKRRWRFAGIFRRFMGA